MQILPDRLKMLGIVLIGGAILGTVLLAPIGLGDAQTLCFPVVLVGIFLLFRPLSPLLFLAPLALWVAGALHLRGIFGEFNRAGYIFRASPDILEQRGLYQDSLRFSRTQGISPIGFVQKLDPGPVESDAWMQKHRGVSFLVRGEGDWLTVQFSSEFTRTQGIRGVTDTDGRITTVKSAAGSFAVIATPTSLALPLEPKLLSAQYLAWITEAFTRGDLDRELGWERQRDALFEAASVLGNWKSSTPRAAAFFFLGTFELLRAGARGSVERGEVACAQRDLRKALTLVQRRYSPELDAVIANNRGVSLLISNPVRRDIRQAAALFRRAVAVRRFEKTVGPSAQMVARVAGENLKSLRQQKKLLLKSHSRKRSKFARGRQETTSGVKKKAPSRSLLIYGNEKTSLFK